jgi:hypothetical protein
MDTNRIASSTDQDVGGLIKGAFQDLEKLATQHIKLFKKEISDDATKAAEGLVALVVGLNIFFIGGVLLAFAASYGLIAAGLPYWASFLIIGILVCIGGGVALFIAQNRIKAAKPIAEKSLHEVEEDAKWLTNPK